MTSQETQERPVPTVPEGTPGRDPRAELPVPLPPGPQQPWRKHGPGTRTWVVVVTAIAAVIMLVLAMVAIGVGVATTAFERKGAVVLTATEYTATTTECTGAGDASAVRAGARVVFSSGKSTFESTLDEGTLRGGRCVFGFGMSALTANPDTNYGVTVGGLEATPVGGEELTGTGSDTVVVYLAR
ncbi:hypothetical protein GCM10027289_26710 [Tsukamurella serpentis]